MLVPHTTKVMDTEVNSKVCQVQTERYHNLFAHLVTYQEIGKVKVFATMLADSNLIPGLTRWKKRKQLSQVILWMPYVHGSNTLAHTYKCKTCPSAALAWRCMPVIPEAGGSRVQDQPGLVTKRVRNFTFREHVQTCHCSLNNTA